MNLLNSNFDPEVLENLKNSKDLMPAFEFGLEQSEGKYDDIFRVVDGQFQVRTNNLIDLINNSESLDDLYAQMAKDMNLGEETV